MTLAILLILLGILFLYIGGEFLVRNASFLARAFGISPMVVGLTVVALGTSSPEMAAVLVAVLKGEHEVGLGGVVGSNISNIGLILGLSALIYPIIAKRLFILRETPFMIFVGLLLIPIIYNGIISRLEGSVLLLFLVLFLWVLIHESHQGRKNNLYPVEEVTGIAVIFKALVGVLFGILFLAGGAHALVEGAIYVAQQFGVPQKVIGLTLVAFGTSLPELASCAVAAYRKETDIVLGNIIGSNIFNILCILGLSAAIQPIQVAYDVIISDIFVMMIFSIIILPFLFTHHKLGRIEGTVLFLGYIYYIAKLFGL